MLNGFLGLPIERETETETEKKGGSPLSAFNPECFFQASWGLRRERERE